MNWFYIILGLILVFYIFTNIKKGHLSIEESFFWMMGSVIIIVLAIFPQIILWIANMVNIEYAPSLLFLLCIVFLLIINFRNSKKIATQQLKIRLLIQEVSIMKNEIDNGEKK